MDEMTDANVMKAVEDIDEDAREYLKLLLSRVMRCFIDPDYKAVMIFKRPGDETPSVCTANCDEETAANVLSQAYNTMIFMSTADAPPKENFN
jgi:hypothetical protein